MSKWEMVRLGDIAKITAGQQAPKDEYFSKEGVPFIRAGSLIKLLNGDDETELELITDDVAETLKLKKQKKGTILFAKSGMSCMKGYVYILKNDCYVVSHLACVYPINLNSTYLSSFLKFNKPNRLIKDESYPSISLKDIEELQIPFPPLEEQKKIANELDKITSLIEKRKLQIEKLDVLVKAKFVEMFGDPVENTVGWEVKTLQKLGNCKNGLNYGANESKFELSCLGVGDFKNKSIIDNITELTTITVDEIPSKDYMLEDEDIVFVRSNGNKNLVGRCVAVYTNNEDLTFSGFCIRYRKTTNELNIRYLLATLKSQSIRKKLLGRGANIQNLNQTMLNELEIPIPPLQLQNQFADYVQKVEQTKETLQKSLSQLETLYKQRMQEYFE